MLEPTRYYYRRRRGRGAAAAARRLPTVAAMDRAKWGDLPENVLLGVTACLPCRADRVRMACVNRQWRAAVREGPRPPPPAPQLPPLPPQLPWLIFPSSATPSFYSWIGRTSHPLPLPPDVRVARFCGSSDGGWFVLALDSSHRYALYNLNSGHRVELPPGIVSPSGKQFPLVARFATLSASPPTPSSSPRPYMLAAVVLVSRRLDVAFWVQGSQCWFPHRGPRLNQPQDVVYYNGGFYFVTADEGVVVYWPGYGRLTNNQMRMRRVEYNMLRRDDYLEDMGFIGGNGSITRYLVESRGQLLMVARYIYNEGGTEVLRVFRFHVMPLTPAAAISGRPRATWLPVDYLEGRMLFVGKGCSRSFEAARFPGFEDAIIYFLDEGFVHDTTASAAVQERPRYSFTDMGRYEMDDMASEAWPPVDRRPTTSDNAPPTWWFP